MKDYIERAVADIARKCQTTQDEVWRVMNEVSLSKIEDHGKQ